MKKPKLALLALGLALSTNATLAAAPAKARCSTKVLQKTLKKSVIPSGLILDSAKVIEAAKGIPSYCDVRGHIHTAHNHQNTEDVNLHQKEIQFRLFLPGNWNQKFLMLGCGGFCGTVDTQPTGLELGYATAATDTGHVSNTAAFWTRNPDGSQNIDRIVNYAHRSPHLVSDAAKAVIKAYYQRAPRLSYFMGGSNGGRQGLIAAQRYPNDFDGIVSLYPAVDIVNALAFFLKNVLAQQSLTKENQLSKELLVLLGKSTMTKCDAADGLIDNMISDPLQCEFDPAKDLPMCSRKQTVGTCFTKEQIQTIKTIMGPTVIAGRGATHQGLSPGYEGVEGNWDKWIVGNEAAELKFAENYVKYFIFNDPDYNVLAFDLQTNGGLFFTSPSGLELDLLLSAKYPDLAEFRARGGKLIIIQGLADPATSVLSTIRYYENMTKVMGGSDKTIEFARMFLVPGLGHGTRPPDHPARFNALLALDKWRESNVAPESLLGYNADTLGVSNVTRPICMYPSKAKYLGSGSIQEAKNFSCKN